MADCIFTVSKIDYSYEKRIRFHLQMKLTQLEIASAIALIGYVAFFTHPPPAFVTSVLGNPVGQAIALLAILYTAMRVSYVIALLLAIAYLASSNPVLEYLDAKEQKPQPVSKGVGAAPAMDILQKLMKGDRMPQKKGKDVTPPVKAVTPPKPAVGKEHFAAF
jgi:hypothetical protein